MAPAPKAVPDRPSSRQNGRAVDGVDLDDQAQRLVLVHLVLAAGQRRVEGHPGVEVRRHGHDDEACVHRGPVGDGSDTVAPARVIGPVDGADRAAEDDVVAQFRGLQQRNLLHPADNPLVQDEVLIREVGEGPGGGSHQDGLQGGEGVGGFGQHAAGDEQADVVAGFLIC